MTDGLRVCHTCAQPHRTPHRWCPKCILFHSVRCNQCNALFDLDESNKLCPACRSQLPMFGTDD